MNKKVLLIISIFFILLLLTDCSKNIKTINILTDDINVYEIADKFNLNNEGIKVFVDYYNVKVEKQNIFKYAQKNKIINFDIIIGEKPGDLIVDSTKYSKITKYSKKLGKEEINKLYLPVQDFIKKYNNYATLYNIDFPVIIARKDNLDKEYINKNLISIEDFYKIASNVNILKQDKKNTESRFGFIPSISNLNEIDFYFIFDSLIIKNKNKYSFDTPGARKAFNLFYEYDNEYNFGIQETNNYLKKFSNIDKKYYLKQKIISFDFINFSNSLNYQQDLYKIFLIKDLKYLNIKNRIITISKKSINKKEAGIFIDYLYNNDIQTNLIKNSIDKIDYYSYLYIPVIKGLIKDTNLNNIIFTETNISLDNYIDNLKYFDFINNKIHKKFFVKYNDTKELINKGVLSKKDLLDHFSQELNK